MIGFQRKNRSKHGILRASQGHKIRFPLFSVYLPMVLWLSMLFMDYYVSSNQCPYKPRPSIRQ